MKAHKAECPSRANFDRFICSVSSSGGSVPAQPVQEEQRQPVRPRQMMVQQNNDDEEENWDHVRLRFVICLSNFFFKSFFQCLMNFSSFRFQYDTPTYDPKQYAMNAKVLRMPQGLTPSQRRQFADAERKRLSQLNQSRSGQHLPR